MLSYFLCYSFLTKHLIAFQGGHRVFSIHRLADVHLHWGATHLFGTPYFIFLIPKSAGLKWLLLEVQSSAFQSRGLSSISGALYLQQVWLFIVMTHFSSWPRCFHAEVHLVIEGPCFLSAAFSVFIMCGKVASFSHPSINFPNHVSTSGWLS